MKMDITASTSFLLLYISKSVLFVPLLLQNFRLKMRKKKIRVNSFQFSQHNTVLEERNHLVSYNIVPYLMYIDPIKFFSRISAFKYYISLKSN